MHERETLLSWNDSKERSATMLNTRFFTLLGIVLAAAAMRLIPHLPNFTPIAAIALFGGAYFPNQKAAFVVTLAAMYLSDLVLGFWVYDFGGFYATMPFVYGSFALTVGLGGWVRRHRSSLRIGAAAAMSAVLFFAVTNFGVWLMDGLYPMTPGGLVACYVAAIPFFRQTLLGNFVYTIVLFGGFALAQRYLPTLRDETATAMART